MATVTLLRPNHRTATCSAETGGDLPTRHIVGLDSHRPVPTAIHIDGLSVQRGESQVLRGISADIPAGAVTAVIGPSGVGKTTLLATLTDLPPASGRNYAVYV